MICLAQKEEARDLLCDRRFLADWAALFSACPWSTPFQSVGFASTWYQVYAPAIEPVLAYERSRQGELIGLLLLAQNPAAGLICAGGNQAEYQGWLAHAENGSDFIERAIQELAARQPASSLTFCYLPPGAPVDWALPGGILGPLCQSEAVRRPLLALDDRDHIDSALRSKHMRVAVNRFKRQGDLRFERITGSEAFDEIFDILIGYYDDRQQVTHRCRPFRDDPNKKLFHCRLMEIPELLHVTVLKAGEQVISAHLGMCGNGVVHMLIPAQSPTFAKDSVGRVHMLMLAQLLQQTQYRILDLTPDENALKKQLATTYDAVHKVTVFLNRRAKIVHDGKQKITAFARRTLAACGLEPKAVKGLVARFRGVASEKNPS